MVRWLRYRIPDAKIWYGGDSSGMCAQELTPKYENELWSLFAKVGHTPYNSSFGTIFAARTKHIVTCKFCGDRPLTNYGGGCGDEFLTCDGCGDRVITHSDGTVSLLNDGEDFFNGAERIKKERAEK